MASFYEILNITNAIYSLLLLITGTVTNILTMRVCYHKDLRKIPAFIFYLFVLVCDTITMYGWTVNTILHVTPIRILWQYEVCVTISFIQSFLSEWTAWCLILMAVERFLGVFKINCLHAKFFGQKQSIISSVVIGSTLFLINFVFVLTLKPLKSIKCVKQPEFYVWARAHILLSSALPIFIIVILNILIIIKIKNENKKIADVQMVNKTKEKTQTSIIVLILTSLYVTFTLQNTLVILFSDRILSFSYGYVFVNISQCIQFTFNSSHFIILYFNKTFKSYFKKVNLKFWKPNFN